jgi:hypothetical protein
MSVLEERLPTKFSCSPGELLRYDNAVSQGLLRWHDKAQNSDVQSARKQSLVSVAQMPRFNSGYILVIRPSPGCEQRGGQRVRSERGGKKLNIRVLLEIGFY